MQRFVLIFLLTLSFKAYGQWQSATDLGQLKFYEQNHNIDLEDHKKECQKNWKYFKLNGRAKASYGTCFIQYNETDRRHYITSFNADRRFRTTDKYHTQIIPKVNGIRYRVDQYNQNPLDFETGWSEISSLIVEMGKKYKLSFYTYLDAESTLKSDTLFYAKRFINILEHIDLNICTMS